MAKPARKTATPVNNNRRDRSPTPKRASPELDTERIYDLDRQVPLDALREPEEISSDEEDKENGDEKKNGEEMLDEDDPATWCITDDFIDLT